MTEPTDNELIACFDMAFSEGLQEALANTTDERLKDLIERRLLVGYYNAIGPSPAPQADSVLEDAARYRWLKSQSKEQLLNPRGAASEFCADMRTHWKLPVLMCSGPIGGYLSFDDSVDILRAAQEGK